MHQDTSSTNVGPAAATLNCTVARLLIESLKAEGVRKIFGIPGGAAVWLMDELRHGDHPIDYVICRHESGAAYMADGWARAGGGLGVVLTTSGPGATNAVTGAMNAQAGHSPVLIITGEVPEPYFGRGYLQEGTDAKLDVNVIFRNAVQSSALISSPLNAQTLLQQALRDACSLPYRAAHISLPNDVAGMCVQVDTARLKPASYRPQTACTDTAAVGQTLHELVHARKPLIFLGNGSREALGDPERLRAFTDMVERFAIPVMTTPDAKGIFPETHPLSLRNYGICGCAWAPIYMGHSGQPDHYDALLVLGSSLGELSTSVVASELYSGDLCPSGPFTQVDLDSSMIGRDFPITRGIVAEVGATLESLCHQARHLPVPHERVEQRRQDVAQIKASHAPESDPAGRASDAAPVHPAALMRVINELVQEGQIFIDAGNCVGWSLNNLVIDPPVRYQSALAMGPMGFGVAAVVGAKMAAPDRPCLAIVGDGAFMMHGAEISTAAHKRVGAVWVVLDDNDLGMVSQGMAQLLPPAQDWDGYYQLGRPDLVKFSEGLGARATAVSHEQGSDAAARAIADALACAQATSQPQVVVVRIDTRPAPPYGWPRLTPPSCATPPAGA